MLIGDINWLMCDLQEAGLSAEQLAWLQQMVTTYGSGFDRAK